MRVTPKDFTTANALFTSAVRVLADCGKNLFEEEFEVAAGLAIDIIVYFTELPIGWVAERAYSGAETIAQLIQNYYAKEPTMPKHIKEVLPKTAENIDFTALWEDDYHRAIASAARTLVELYRMYRRQGSPHFPDYRTFVYTGQVGSGLTYWRNPADDKSYAINLDGKITSY